MNPAILMLLLLALGVTACAEQSNTPDADDADRVTDTGDDADDADSSTSEEEAQDATHATAGSYWAAISDAEYRTWAKAPGWETPTATSGTHGPSKLIYVNSIVETALGQSGLSQWPVGSWIVKDAFDDQNQHSIVASMEKMPDGKWFWAEYDANGAVIAFNRPSSCAGCHGSGDDSVRAFALP